jgi:hypothetical protein
LAIFSDGRTFSGCVQVPEHTWGVDIKTYLSDYANWTNVQLQQQLADGVNAYLYTESAWARQHDYTRWAMNALQPGSSAVCALGRHCFVPSTMSWYQDMHILTPSYSRLAHSCRWACMKMWFVNWQVARTVG